MRERVKKFFDDFEKAFQNLKIGVEKSEDELDIDGTIKRFELCYEISWKLIKQYLEDVGIICKNQKDCFKQVVLNSIIENEYDWMNMCDDRNLLVHTYTFEESRKIFDKIKEKYVKLFENFYEIMKERVKMEE